MNAVSVMNPFSCSCVASCTLMLMRIFNRSCFTHLGEEEQRLIGLVQSTSKSLQDLRMDSGCGIYLVL